MRVHHDSSIDQNLKCELECLKDEKGNLLDNVDFCNIEKVPGHQNPQFNYNNWSDILQGKSHEVFLYIISITVPQSLFITPTSSYLLSQRSTTSEANGFL